MKRLNDDEGSLSLSYHSFESDVFTPLAKRRFSFSSNINLTKATTVLPSQPSQSSQQQLLPLPPASPSTSYAGQSLTSPPPSPLNVHSKQSETYVATNSTQDSEDWKLSERPPPNVSPEEYDRVISDKIPEPIRMSQVMVWSAYEAMQRKEATFGRRTANEQKADRIASDIQTRMIQGLVKGEISTSVYANIRSSSTMNTVKKKANPRNELNRQRIKYLKEALTSLETEDYEWREVTSKLFHQHAAMLDEASRSSLATTTTTTKEPIPITQDLLDGLGDDEKQFLDTYCREETNNHTNSIIEHPIKPSDMEVQVTELRERLSTVKEFQRSVEKFCRNTMADITRNMQRGAFAVPAEKASLANAVAQEKALEDLRKKTSKDILRMLSQYTANNLNK